MSQRTDMFQHADVSKNKMINNSAKTSGLANLCKVSLLGGSVLLSGCAGTHFFSPSTWFSSPLIISSSGVGQVTGSTKMQLDTVKQQLDDRYEIREGMQMENGEIVTVFQGIDDDKVKVEVIGPEHGDVSNIIVSDPNIVTEWGTEIGTSFSQIYEKAFGACKLGKRVDDIPTVECLAPQSTNVVYRFSGKWQGPEGLMPSDEVLKEWQVSQIIWTR